jgi:glycosyltransferase involved in cell wall biosynthesis
MYIPSKFCMTETSSNYKHINLLVVEDFEFVANGGIDNVISSLVPELSASCGNLIWLLPDYKAKLRANQGILNNNQILSFKPPLFRKGWIVYLLSRIVTKIDKFKLFKKLLPSLARLAKMQRLEAIIRDYDLCHYLNLGVFDQNYPNLSIPVFGIVYDINFQQKWRKKCIENVHDWCQNSDGVLTISESAKQEILSIVNSQSSKIAAVPLAINKPCQPIPSRLQQSKSAVVPTFFYPASLNPHKNHLNLLEALQLLHYDGYQFKLVLSGYDTHKLLGISVLDHPCLEAARLFLLRSNLAFRACVEIHGMVQQDTLEYLFATADYVVLPSTYEGFGLPLLEALVREVPVICSDLPAFREQLNQYAIEQGVSIVRSNSVADWATAIKTELDQPSSQRMAAPRICNEREMWNWSDVANSYLSFMESKGRTL